MKKEIHPVYEDTTITCACGNVIKTRSTRKNIRVEVCSVCHPFFSGQSNLIKTTGRADKFKKKYAAAPTRTAATKEKKKKKK